MPVLDTNFLIRLDARDPAAEKALRAIEAQDLVLPAQAAAEYLAGVADPEAELARLHAGFRVVQTTDVHLLVVARLAAKAFAAFEVARPRWGDLHIAAAALLEGTYVVTTNKRHFTRLGVAAWHYLTEMNPPKPGR
jgi:predicted nucleic acid-binding protein